MLDKCKQKSLLNFLDPKWSLIFEKGPLFYCQFSKFSGINTSAVYEREIFFYHVVRPLWRHGSMVVTSPPEIDSASGDDKNAVISLVPIQ
jgi:hypothetical protein